MAKAGLISLGCPRNLVDSETILGSLKRCGFEIADVEKGVDVCVINTCAFVRSAREEAVEMIRQASRLKEEGRVKKLVVCGCLAQLYKDELLRNIPAVDLVIGTSDIPHIADSIGKIEKNKRDSAVSRRLDYLYDELTPRSSLTPGHYAYVKISEGCDNSCSYCIISRLRGRFRSRPMASVIREVNKLSESGALKEVNLIGQDTTLFGIDRCGKVRFPELLKKLCTLKNGVRWIRILYTHPAHYSDNLIGTIRDEEKICKYLDLPVQHISDKILKAMNRPVSKSGIIRLIDRLRGSIPGLVLRTSIIVGFPGETEKDFKELARFVRDTKFERLGVFVYSREEGTPAYRYPKQLPEKIKSERFDELMKLQQAVSAEVNRSRLGSVMDVLIDEKVEGESDKYLGRTYQDAPEVDGGVYVSGKGLKVGEFYKVKIKDTLEYDLVGDAV